MRVGLALPHYDYSFPEGLGAGPLSWPRLVEAAQRAEGLGFDSLWISDHFFLDLARYGGPGEPFGSVEPFTALAALATATTRARLGTLVACAPFRHPAHVAKMATTIDLVSGGRFDLGIGAGWYGREFDAFGYPYASTGERFRMLEEYVEAIHALFGPGPVSVEGRFVHIDQAFNHPVPAQEGGPPIWVGGKGGRRLLRLVARHAAGWNSVWRWTFDDFAERVTALSRACEAEGRDPSTARVSLGLYALVGESPDDVAARYGAMQRWAPGGALDDEPLDRWANGTLTGTVEQCGEQLERFAGIGVEEVIVGAGPIPFSIHDWSMVELIGSELIPRAHRLGP